MTEEAVITEPEKEDVLTKIFNEMTNRNDTPESRILELTKNGAIFFGGTTIMFKTLKKATKVNHTNIEDIANALVCITIKVVKATSFLQASATLKPAKKVIAFI